LISIMFDIEMMKNTLIELEIDVKKMPLGKLTKRNIQNGFEVLNEIQAVLDSGEKNQEARLLDLTNKFFTIIPQDFGEERPQPIDNLETLKKKVDMLEALQDIEIATSLLQGDSASGSALDDCYKKLNTAMTPLDKSSDEYKTLKEYCEKGHDTKYFRDFTLEVEDIFAVKRVGADELFAPWKDNTNRQLLWHGSRLSNFGGILSQGLRIAPPEAPKSGYRFGKGIYFADCVSKSASYCRTSKEAPTGIMLLNEVALGRMCELLDDKYMEKPQPGTDSTKALGATAPDPNQDIFWNGVKIPRGAPKHTGIRSSCSHNEFIVYDVAQVHIKYLLKIKFNHKW